MSTENAANRVKLSPRSDDEEDQEIEKNFEDENKSEEAKTVKNESVENKPEGKPEKAKKPRRSKTRTQEEIDAGNARRLAGLAKARQKALTQRKAQKEKLTALEKYDNVLNAKLDEFKERFQQELMKSMASNYVDPILKKINELNEAKVLPDTLMPHNTKIIEKLKKEEINPKIVGIDVSKYPVRKRLIDLSDFKI